MKCKLKKHNQGEIFNNLEMINNFIGKIKDKKPIKNKNKPIIEVLDSTTNNNFIDEEEENKEKDINIFSKDEYKYGFNDSFSKFFNDLSEELLEISGLNPDESNKC